MFNSSYGGIESDGFYRNPPREQPIEQPVSTHSETTASKHEKKGLFENSLFKKFEIDDLLLIGIALLLLLDGDGDNDIFVFIIAALIFMS